MEELVKTYNDNEELVKTYHDNGVLKERYYKVDNKIEGIYESWYYNGSKCIECTYVNNKKNGLLIVFSPYSSDKDQESYYLNGKRHGLSAWFVCGKKYREAEYIDDKLHGLYTVWDNEGQINILKVFINDNFISFKDLAIEQTKTIKEELVATVWNPDRLERIAFLYNMNAMEYMDSLE